MTKYNILDFGAKENTLSTKAVQNAIDAAYLNGGGEVTVPKGRFVIGTVRLRSNVVFHMLSGAYLIGSDDINSYGLDYNDQIEPVRFEDGIDEECLRGNFLHPWYNGIIMAFKAENVKIIGEGDSVIDGRNLYNPDGEEGYRGPQAICMTYCKNMEFSNYTVKDSANWAHTIHKCQNIFAHGLTVLGGHDGFHVRICKNILIEDSEFYTGDDCIAGYVNENMVVRNCMLDCACSAMRLGGTDILVDNCKTHAPSRYGFRGSLSKEEKASSADTNESCRHTQHTPFLYFCDYPAKVKKPQGNIVIQNCEFEQPNSFFRLRFGQQWCTNRCLNDITFINCKCTGVSLPIDLYCDKDEPCTLKLIDCEISARENFENAPFMNADGFKLVYFDGVKVTGYSDPTVFTKTDGEIILKNSTPLKIVKTDRLIDKYV